MSRCAAAQRRSPAARAICALRVHARAETSRRFRGVARAVAPPPRRDVLRELCPAALSSRRHRPRGVRTAVARFPRRRCSRPCDSFCLPVITRCPSAVRWPWSGSLSRRPDIPCGRLRRAAGFHPSAPVGSGVPRPSVTRGSPWRPGACPRWWPGHAAAPGGRRSSPRRPLFRGRRRAVRPRRTAALLTAAQQLGSAVATTEMAVGYAREREQFGTADRRLPGRKTPVRTDAGSGLNGSERGVCRRPDGSGE